MQQSLPNFCLGFVFGIILGGILFCIWSGCHNPLEPWSRAARKWRENEEMKRKWRENEEMKRKWTENEEMERRWRENEEMDRE